MGAQAGDQTLRGNRGGDFWCLDLLEGEPGAAADAHESERKEQAERNVAGHQHAIDQAHRGAKKQLAFQGGGGGAGIRHHVEGEEHEGHAGDGQQGRQDGGAKPDTADKGLQHKGCQPGADERHALGEAAVEERAGDDDCCRQEPITSAVEIFGELVGGRDTHPGEEEQNQGDAEVGGVEKVASFAVGGNPENGLGANGDGRGQGDGPEVGVAVKQHGDCQGGDMGRQQEVDQLLAAARESEGASLHFGFHKLQQQFHAVAGGQRYQGIGIGRLEAEHGVSQQVQGGDGDGKTPQTSQTVGGRQRDR